MKVAGFSSENKNHRIPIHWRSFGRILKDIFYRNVKISNGWIQFFQLWFNHSQLHIYLRFLEKIFNAGKQCCFLIWWHFRNWDRIMNYNSIKHISDQYNPCINNPIWVWKNISCSLIKRLRRWLEYSSKCSGSLELPINCAHLNDSRMVVWIVRFILGKTSP